MTIREFELMEHPFGYKAEYWDGKAVITPKEQNVTTRLAIKPQSIHNNYDLRPITSNIKQELIQGYIEVFQDSIEFCNWPQNEIRKHATRHINGYFSGKKGNPCSTSTIAITADKNSIVGLALFLINKREQVILDLLYVKPAWQRQKVATTLVSSAINHLHGKGIKELYSAYHICNKISQKWHHEFGFEDKYDQLYIRQKYDWYQQEIWRQKELNKQPKIKELNQKMRRWQALLDDEWKSVKNALFSHQT